MKKVCILSNHIYPFHVGGSEMVIKNVTENLLHQGVNVDVFGWDVPKDQVIEGIKLNKMTTERIKNILSTYDIIIVYSDAFINFINLLKLNSSFNKKIIIFPVGFTGMKSNPALKEVILHGLQNLLFVCHDKNYVDAIFLEQHGIPYSIIPNGVCEKEFNFSSKQFSETLNKKIICVANTFPKKGHAELLQVCDLLSQKIHFTLDVFCHTPSWEIGKRMQNQLINFVKSKNYKVNFNIDRSRLELIKALEHSDLFLFCSLKEVAPLCIIESAASGLPWLSFKVGNVSQIGGGVVNNECVYDQSGYVVPDSSLIKHHSDLALSILNDKKRYNQLSLDGVNFSKQFTWQKIANSYASLIQN